MRTLKRSLRLKAAAALLPLLLLLASCGGDSVPAPSHVTAVLEDDSTVLVSWEAVSGAEGYRVFRRIGSEADYQHLCDTRETTLTDSGLTHGETYFYKVKTLMDGQLSQAAESAPLSLSAAPALTRILSMDETHLAVTWEDTGAEKYRLYGLSGGEWVLAAETAEPHCVLDSFSAYTQLAVCSVQTTASGEAETPRSQPQPLLTASRVTAVTQLDRYTAAVQYDAVEGAALYRIYRGETEHGSYTLAGTSYDPVYYDAIEDGRTYFYQVQPVSDCSEGPYSPPVALGTNAKPVSAVAVFMYHEFVTQEDLDAGVAFDEYAVWTDEFEQDLRYLKENGYTTITSAQLADFLNGRSSLPEKPVMLTIDDGKLGVYKHAYPLLREYGMTAVLAVIGERIEDADAEPDARATDTAPYCTWAELREMSDSGAIEVVSHSYMRHRYRNGGHTGADIMDGESEEAFYQIAYKDYTRMNRRLLETIGKETTTFSYPYSVRSPASDRIWLRCGYEILLCGDDSGARASHLNYYIQDAGVNYYSARTRRLVRMTGTPLRTYLENAVHYDDWPLP